MRALLWAELNEMRARMVRALDRTGADRIELADDFIRSAESVQPTWGSPCSRSSLRNSLYCHSSSNNKPAIVRGPASEKHFVT